MNIKQAAEQSGVSSPNIRFYEKEGLMTPARNRGNAYRDYTAGDIRTLKLIRMLRMLDMPLPVIQRVLNGEQPLSEALQAQQEVLEQQAAQLAGAIRFCAELTQQTPQVDQLDVADCQKRMQDPQEPGRFFSGWLRDYRTVAENEQKKRFFRLLRRIFQQCFDGNTAACKQPAHCCQQAEHKNLVFLHRHFLQSRASFGYLLVFENKALGYLSDVTMNYALSRKELTNKSFSLYNSIKYT